jgi:hypothetical protein
MSHPMEASRTTPHEMVDHLILCFFFILFDFLLEISHFMTHILFYRFNGVYYATG